jgi:chromosome segregation ATPase
MRWLIERQLKQTSARLRSAREDLRGLDYEVDSFVSDADDLQVLSRTSDRIDADADFAEAARQVEVLQKARENLRTRINGLVAKQDELLDRLGSETQ